MRTIWKYTLKLAQDMTVPMPEGARILHGGVSAGVPCLWAEVESEAEPVPRRFAAFGTGGWMPEGLGPHIATFDVALGGIPSVWHLYELWPGPIDEGADRG